MNTRLGIIALAAAMAGCATQNAVFITKTSISVLDVDATPAGASLAYDRTEGYAGPRFDNGTVYPVTGYFQTSGGTLQRSVRQVFAGGEAAALVLGKPSSPAIERTCGDDRKQPPLLFGTGTTMGIKVGFADGAPLPNSFVFGYRRKEAASIPVTKDCHPSILAVLDSDGKARTKPDQPKLDAGVDQYFATGAAADLLAQDPKIQELFKKAKDALVDVAAFNQREAAQAKLTLDTVQCAGKIADGQFDRVITNADELSLFSHPNDASFIRSASNGPERLQRYVGRISLRIGDEDPRTTALEMHKKRVCAMAA